MCRFEMHFVFKAFPVWAFTFKIKYITVVPFFYLQELQIKYSKGTIEKIAIIHP